MCEIATKDNVKTVTLRSTYKVENQTFYPLEIALVDDTGHPVYPIEKLGTEALVYSYQRTSQFVSSSRRRFYPSD